MLASMQKALGETDTNMEGYYSLLLAIITLVALWLLHCMPCKGGTVKNALS